MSEIDDTVSEFEDFLNDRGCNVTGIAGEGSTGFAYFCTFHDVPRILKITTDASEARACKLLLNKNFKNIVNVQDVFRLDDYDAIVKERLSPLTGLRAQRIENALEELDHYTNGEWSLLMFRILDNEVDPDVESEVEALGIIKTEILPIIQQLNQAGISGHNDINVENLMLRGNDLVLVDLGGSEIKGRGLNELRKFIKTMIGESFL